MSALRSGVGVTMALAAQHLPGPALEALRVRRLKRMIAHCAREVPLYRELFRAAGVGPESLRSVADLARFPIPDRALIERDPSSIVAASFRALYASGRATVRRSGGSSGGPRLEIHADPTSWSMLDGFYFRALFALGYSPLTPMAYFWGAPFENRGFNRIGLMPKIGVPAHMDEDGQILILEQNPGVFWYYHPTSLYALAQRFGSRLGAARPACIVSHAELLTDSMRAAIESAAGVPVYDQWGTSELNRMAWQCKEHCGYHVDADSFVLEILDGDGRPVKPGETGRAVVTGLINRMMPLVRYELGDLVVASDRRCACGRTLPMIERIEGRVKDVVVLPDGGTRTPREMLEPYGSIDGLEQFRVVVDEPTHARIDYVTSRSEGAPIAEEIARRFGRACPGMRASVARIDTIPKAPTGKRVMMRNESAAPTRGIGPAFVE